MNKMFFMVALALSAVNYGYTQDSVSASTASKLLSIYYNIKDALVAGNPTTAAAKADAFVKAANGIDYKIISEGNINALIKDAGKISETKDLKKQREYFSDFSANMVTLAKSKKISDQPVYVEYCPMKKASWLSSEKAIKNPYYGSSMLTCGEIKETIQ